MPTQVGYIIYMSNTELKSDKWKEERARHAIEFMKQAYENLKTLIDHEVDSEFRDIITKTMTDLDYMRYALRGVKATYTALAEEEEYAEEGFGVDKDIARKKAEARAKILRDRIKAEDLNFE